MNHYRDILGDFNGMKYVHEIPFYVQHCG